jgi:hypothetical protein
MRRRKQKARARLRRKPRIFRNGKLRTFAKLELRVNGVLLREVK